MTHFVVFLFFSCSSSSSFKARNERACHASTRITVVLLYIEAPKKTPKGAILSAVILYISELHKFTWALVSQCCCLPQALETLPEDLAAMVVSACPRSIGVRMKKLPQHLHHLIAAIPAWQEVCSQEQCVGACPVLALAAVLFRLCSSHWSHSRVLDSLNLFSYVIEFGYMPRGTNVAICHGIRHGSVQCQAVTIVLLLREGQPALYSAMFCSRGSSLADIEMI